MVGIEFHRHREAENYVHRFVIGCVEVDGLGPFEQCGDSVLQTGYAAMRKRNAAVEARAAKALTLHQALENILATDAGDGAHEQFAENFQTVFLAACMRVAQHAVRLDDRVLRLEAKLHGHFANANGLGNTEAYWQGQAIVGFLKLRQDQVPKSVPAVKALEVQQLYVSADQQRRGIGRRLMDQAVDVARDLSVQGLWLSVWEEADWAIFFYRHYGYQTVGTTDFWLGDSHYNDFLMWFPADADH